MILWDDSDGEETRNQPLLESSPVERVGSAAIQVQRFNAGRTSVAEHCIQTGEIPRIWLALYRLPHAYRETVKTKLEHMERDGVIERSSNEWAAPIVLVRKKDGSLRMCVDYRRLNAVAKADAYPMPRVHDLVDKLGEVSTLDLARRYWQVLMKKDFGLHGAPATFQCMMDKLLAGDSEYAAAYLDDIVIHSRSWDDHLRHLRMIFQRLQQSRSSPESANLL